MTTRFISLLGATLVVAALAACSDTSARSATTAETSPVVDSAASTAITSPAAPATTTTTPIATTTTTAPPTTAPPTTAPTTTAPPTTAPPTTTPPTTTAPVPLEIVRGPIVVRLSDECYESVWPIKVFGTIENRDPLNPAAMPVAREFEVSLQPQQYLDVIDDTRGVAGHEGDIQSVITIHVAHFTDPGTYEMPISSMTGTIYNSWPLGAVDVLAPSATCYLTLTFDQSPTV